MGAEDAAALKALSREVTEAQAALAPLEEGAAGLRARAAGLEKAVEDAGGPPVKRQRARVAQLKEARAPLLASLCSSLCLGFCHGCPGAGRTSLSSERARPCLVAACPRRLSMWWVWRCVARERQAASESLHSATTHIPYSAASD